MWEKSKLRWGADCVDSIMDEPPHDECGHLAPVRAQRGETEDSAALHAVYSDWNSKSVRG